MELQAQQTCRGSGRGSGPSGWLPAGRRRRPRPALSGPAERCSQPPGQRGSTPGSGEQALTVGDVAGTATPLPASPLTRLQTPDDHPAGGSSVLPVGGAGRKGLLSQGSRMQALETPAD